LREWREHLNLSVERLADRIGENGVAPNTVARWEKWRDRKKGRRPDINALAAIAEAMGIGLWDLYRHPKQLTANDLLRDQPPEVVAQALKLIQAIRV